MQEIKRVPLLKSLGLFLGHLSFEATLYFLNKTKRDSFRVDSEYDQNAWKKILDGQAWTRYTKLEDFVCLGFPEKPITAIVNGEWVEISNHDYYRHRNNALTKIIEKHLQFSSTLVELGCGFGYNILWLASQLPQKQFIGLDISENGRKAGQLIADHFGIKNIRFEHLDMLAPNDPNWKLVEGNVAMTFASIEQVGRGTNEVISNILNAKPKEVVHFETSFEDLDLMSPQDWLTRIYIRRKDYVQNLKQILQDLQSQNKLKLVDNFRFPYSPRIKNDFQVRIWRPL